MFQCQECNEKFQTSKAAERAMLDGCPKCGGADIDLDMEAVDTRITAGQKTYADATAD